VAHISVPVVGAFAGTVEGWVNRRISKGLIKVLVLPVLISSAITSPTPGPSWKPWPQKPNA
jgi:hypothetical protein